MDKNVQEIQAEHGGELAVIANTYNARMDEIREERDPEEGVYLDRLSDRERMDLLREQKVEKAQEAHSRAVTDYTSKLEEYRSDLTRRRESLRGRLFGVEDAGALSRAALASREELEALMDLATHTGNSELGKATFVAAERRGFGDLAASYFDTLDLEARDLYAEWKELPAEEVLERQSDSVSQILPEPDPEWLMPPARMGAF